jgi:ADP-ribose pyrophosphatase YjhB (NUDIX family)
VNPTLDCSRSASGPIQVDAGTRVVRLGAVLTKRRFTAGSLSIVCDAAGDVLLVQERWRDRQRWGLPGGFRRYRESERTTAVRELREETGLVVDESALVLLSRCPQQWAAHFDSLFTVSLPEVAPAVQPRRWEIRDCAWVDVREAVALTLPAHHAIYSHWRP